MLDSKIHSGSSPSVKSWHVPIVAVLLTLGLLGGCTSKPAVVSPPAEKSSETKPAATTGKTGKIDVNNASIAELDKLELPGTKPSLSERIQGKRPYAKAEDLVGKKAISPEEYKLIKNLIVVGKAK